MRPLDRIDYVEQQARIQERDELWERADRYFVLPPPAPPHTPELAAILAEKQRLLTEMLPLILDRSYLSYYAGIMHETAGGPRSEEVRQFLKATLAAVDEAIKPHHDRVEELTRQASAIYQKERQRVSESCQKQV